MRGARPPWLSLFGLVFAAQLGVGAVLNVDDLLRPKTLVAALVVALLVALATRPWRTGMRSADHRPVPTLPSADQGAATACKPDEPKEGQDTRSLTRLEAQNHRLRRELARMRAIYRHSHDAVMLIDPPSGRLVDANPGAAILLGVPETQLVGHHIDELHDEDPDYLRHLFDEAMDSPGGYALRLNYRASDGRSVPVEVSLSRISWKDGRLLLCVARDLSERESANAQIEHLAYHDTLTGLPNRALLTDRVSRALARSRRTALGGALLFLDLDKFKRINDSLGHAVGDALLQELAARLKRTLREEDTIARLGGDEFVILLEGLGQSAGAVVEKGCEIGEKVRRTLNDPFLLHDHELHVTASIGIVAFPRDGDTVDTLLRHADTAMYHAKGAGRDAAKLFERQMDEAAISRLAYEQDLRRGLQEDQFELFFQPMQAIRDGQPLGAEVLVRWRHPEHGLIAPSEFLPYIENSALMLKLDDWVLRETCRLLCSFQEDPTLDAPDCLGINIGHQQFERADFANRVREILEATGADPHRLQFEITETVLIRDDKQAIDRMHALRNLGIRFALDDFGTGYSSLTDLRRLPIETLKIDRSLVRDIANDPHDEAIVRAILSMATHIGLEVVAEGVETREQLAVLRDATCSYYQGFLGRPPIGAAAFREELAYRSYEAATPALSVSAAASDAG